MASLKDQMGGAHRPRSHVILWASHRKKLSSRSMWRFDLKKSKGVPEMALRGYRASHRGSKMLRSRLQGALVEALAGSSRGSENSKKNTQGSKRLGALFWCPIPRLEFDEEHFLAPRHPHPLWILKASTNGQVFSVAPPAEPCGEKKLLFVQILGGETLLKFGEKWAVKNF